VIVAYIDAHRERVVEGRRLGVEPICEVLRTADVQIAPSTYYASKTRPPSARAVRDAELVPVIRQVHKDNLGVYGVRKVHAELHRMNMAVARCTIERLMRSEDLRGIPREKSRKTTLAEGAQSPRPADLVDRQFLAAAPNQLWVADLTYVRTHSGWVYAAFVLDVFSRMIVGWQVSTSLRTDLALDALDMGLWARQRAGQDVAGLKHHSDRGVQGGLNRSSQHLTITEVFDGTTSAEGGSRVAPGDAIPGSSLARSACRARILAPDRARQTHRGSRARDRRVDTGGLTLVSPRWRHATAELGRADRPLPLVLRA
jgi:putative transposase